VVLSRTVSAEPLHANLAALHVPWDQAADEELRAVAESPEVYWATRARLPWN
jgi:hypothetical protein